MVVVDTGERLTDSDVWSLTPDKIIQEAVEKDNPGATILPIIISTDKTQLTTFGNKSAYQAML
jgi:hypothetical protein